jgi:hypothetical protein
MVDLAVAVDRTYFRNDKNYDNNDSFYRGQRNGQTGSHSQPPASTPTGTAPMDVDTYVRHPKLTPETRAQCIAERRCFLCRQPNHTKFNCPNRRPSNPNGRRQ